MHGNPADDGSLLDPRLKRAAHSHYGGQLPVPKPSMQQYSDTEESSCDMLAEAVPNVPVSSSSSSAMKLEIDGEKGDGEKGKKGKGKESFSQVGKK